MDERGDGVHVGRNRPYILLYFNSRGDQAVPNERQAGLPVWLEFFLRHDLEEIVLAMVNELINEENNNNNNENNVDNAGNN
ncbi:hypothetical protein E3U43_012859 [Larimichthys crocea]|uniref:Uncharacterized protein n=1 Tax=Larimichthys crocea TaxID=215358 RepID=A0ACD3RV54_LARCR|nr:hypothetical protein E3U43_012859 [Larimichthys crocea]